ncbi:MAG TPA: TonB-dependent receptor, partial [Candidatus Binatia bacterium]|nr:TonB-dependent receptor [Candidatus Binatia bacterium]
DRSARESEETEQVLRGEYSWRMGEADYQVSGEAAFNAIDNVTRLFALEPDGSETEIPFPNGVAVVEEDRYEIMGTYGRQLTPALQLQLSAGGEYSQLAQIGGNGLTREFIRPKGQVSLVWQIDEDTRLNTRLQRRVGQLNFFDFLASVNLNDGTEFDGNPDLVPPQSWEFDAEFTRNYGAWGNILLRVYGAAIQDIVDIVPVDADGQSVGNLDEAMRYGVEWRSTTNFDPIGLAGLKLDSRFMLQESEVEDPLTGETREISNSFLRLASLTLRYDPPGTDWAYGAMLSHERYAPSYRLNEVFDLYEMPIFGRVFVENKDVFGLTTRLTVSNVFDGGSFLYRTAHDGRRTDPVLNFEQRERDIGPIFSIDIRGRF